MPTWARLSSAGFVTAHISPHLRRAPGSRAASTLRAPSRPRRRPQPLPAKWSQAEKRASPTCAVAAMPAYKSVSLSPDVEVFIRPVRADNFSYLVWDKARNVSAVVDPFSPAGLVSLAESLGAPITTALCTHHHKDHSGGNVELTGIVPGVEIVGSTYETAPGVTVGMSHDDTRTIKGGSLSFRALHTPCHTNGHICFVLQTETPAVFSGDTLFVGGCGRFFEGDAEDMEKSLNVTLAGLPDDCLVFCGHEYTVSNLRFAAAVDPGNESVRKKLAWAALQLERGEHTVPSTVGEEKTYNPFMRTGDPALAAAVGVPGGTPGEVMASLRKRKDAF
jgi:hydroxyacylglutathione hydrolase